MIEDTRSSGWLTFERVVTIIGMLGLAFTAGQNWHRLDGVENAVQALSRQDDEIKADYERKDVLDQQLSNIVFQLSEIRKSVNAKDK